MIHTVQSSTPKRITIAAAVDPPGNSMFVVNPHGATKRYWCDDNSGRYPSAGRGPDAMARENWLTANAVILVNAGRTSAMATTAASSSRRAGFRDEFESVAATA